jgi:hypothetical protein
MESALHPCICLLGDGNIMDGERFPSSPRFSNNGESSPSLLSMLAPKAPLKPQKLFFKWRLLPIQDPLPTIKVALEMESTPYQFDPIPPKSLVKMESTSYSLSPLSHFLHLGILPPMCNPLVLN